MTEVKNQNLVGSSNLGKIREEIAMWDDLEQEALLFIDSVDMIDNPKQPIDDLIEFCDLTYKMAQNYIKSESLLKSKNISQQDINKIKKVAQKLASNAYETKLLLMRVKSFADTIGERYSHLKNNKDINISMFRWPNAGENMRKLGINEEDIKEYIDIMNDADLKLDALSKSWLERTDLLQRLSYEYEDFQQINKQIQQSPKDSSNGSKKQSSPKRTPWDKVKI